VKTAITTLTLHSPATAPEKILITPQVQGIGVAPISVEVMNIEPYEQEGK
jgi:hypothetical protein